MDFSNMSDDEMKARGDAAALGQLKIMQATIEALIGVSPQPDYIQFRIAQAMASIVSAEEAEPGLAWVPEAIALGAQPVAERFLAACEANMDRPTK